MNHSKNYYDYVEYVKQQMLNGVRPKNIKYYRANRDKYQFYEFHHIVPKCFGGSNDDSNLIALTPREHFLAHYLLCKMNEDNKDHYYRMLNAFSRMAKCGMYNSRMYDFLRKDLAKHRGERFSRGNSPCAKRVINLETLEVFNCVKDACAKYNVSNVSNCCRNEINETKGTFWQYFDETKSDDYWKQLYKEKKLKSEENYKIRFCGENNCKKKVVASTGETFNSIKEACKWCRSNSVGACARGLRKHAGKHPETKEPLSWKFG